VTGTSRLPENVTAHHVYGFFSIDIEIEKDTDIVVDFASTLVPRLVEKVISDTFIGYPFEEGIVNTTEKLNDRFFSSTKKAILAALDDANKWFFLYKREASKAKGGKLMS
jgi:hypothetical protein